MFAAGRFAIARQMRRVNLEVASEVFEERIGSGESARAMEEQQGLALASDFHLDGKLAVAQFLMCFHYFTFTFFTVSLFCYFAISRSF